MAKPSADQQETVKLLKELLALAEAGSIDGVAAVAISRDHHGHQGVACGSAVRYVAHTLGAMRLLADDLSAMCRAQDPDRD